MLSTRLLITENLDSKEFALTICGKKKKVSKIDLIEFGYSLKMNEK